MDSQKINDDEFLKELWQKSEDLSYMDVLDPSGLFIKNEVMGELINMMASVETPKPGESTSNLYRILVKRLRNQISNFDKDPEVVEITSQKLAKWVEGLIKEAYYRKHGKMPRNPQTKAACDTLKELTRKVKEETEKSENDFKPELDIQVINCKKRIDKPKTVIIDGEVYVLKPKHFQENDNDRKDTIEVKYRKGHSAKRPTVEPEPTEESAPTVPKLSENSFHCKLIKTDISEIPSYNVLNDSDFALTPFGYTDKTNTLQETLKKEASTVDKEYVIEDIVNKTAEDILNADSEENIKAILKRKMQDFSKESVVNQIESKRDIASKEVSKINSKEVKSRRRRSRGSSAKREDLKENLKDESKKEHKKTLIKLMRSANLIKSESTLTNDSTNAMVRGWGSWMSDLTRRAKNLVTWEGSNVEMSSSKYLHVPKEKSGKDLKKKSPENSMIGLVKKEGLPSINKKSLTINEPKSKVKSIANKISSKSLKSNMKKENTKKSDEKKENTNNSLRLSGRAETTNNVH